MPDLYAAIRAQIDSNVTQIKGSNPDTFEATAANDMGLAILAVLERHKPDQWGNCSECREGGPGYEAEGVRAPCPSVKDIAEALGVQT